MTTLLTRRFVLSCTSLCLAVIVPAMLVGQEWNTYGRDATHAAYVPVTLNSQGFQLEWERTATVYGFSGFRKAASPTTIAGDRVYFPTRSATSLYALESADLITGQTSWQVDFDPNFRDIGGPAIYGDRVYVHLFGHSGTTGSTPDPTLYGLNAVDGSQIFATTHQGQSNSGGQPVVSNGMVFLPGGYYGGLDAYDAITGARLWFTNVHQRYEWSPSVIGSSVFVYDDSSSSYRGRLSEYDIFTGTVIQRIDDSANSSLAVQDTRTAVLDGNGHALVNVKGWAFTTPTRLISFDINAGTIAWEAPLTFDSNGPFEIATDGNFVYASTTSTIFEVSAATGQVLRTWPTPAKPEYGLVLTDSHLIVSTEDETILLSRVTFQPDQILPVGGRVAFGGGYLLVSNSTGISAYQPIPVTVEVNAETVVVNLGKRSGGDLASLTTSDDQDYSARRKRVGSDSISEIELTATSPTDSPSALEFVVESAATSRSRVAQVVSFYDFNSGLWEAFNVTPVSKSDSVATIVPQGDLSRFVDQQTGEIRARIRQTINIRKKFEMEVDQAIWRITD